MAGSGVVGGLLSAPSAGTGGMPAGAAGASSGGRSGGRRGAGAFGGGSISGDAGLGGSGGCCMGGFGAGFVRGGGFLQTAYLVGCSARHCWLRKQLRHVSAGTWAVLRVKPAGQAEQP